MLGLQNKFLVQVVLVIYQIHPKLPTQLYLPTQTVLPNSVHQPPNPTWVSLPQRLGRPHLEQEPTTGNKTTVNHLAAQKDHTCEDHVLGVDHEL